MSDFLARENELLGDEFSDHTQTGGSFATATGGDEIDFDRAASAFPDISLDGDVPSVPSGGAAASSGGFDFDSFDAPLERTTEVKVTGDDEIEKFESEFPDIEVPSAVSSTSCCPLSAGIHANTSSATAIVCLSPYSADLWCNSSVRTAAAAVRIHANLDPAN